MRLNQTTPLKKLKDPCFVQFVDFFFVEREDVRHREAFLVMAFLDGMPGNSLRDAIRDSVTGLPPKDVFLAFKRFAHGLSLLHKQGIIHRNIKPSNLYYPKGAPDKSAIMDFGIIRDIHGTQTKDGGVPGTFDYMPPEVVLTGNRGDAKTDLFALGLCLYEALTGKTGYPRLPSGNAALPAFLERAKKGTPAVFYDPKIQGSHDILALLYDITNIDPSQRINDAAEVERRIDKLLDDFEVKCDFEVKEGQNEIDLQPLCLYACPSFFRSQEKGIEGLASAGTEDNDAITKDPDSGLETDFVEVDSALPPPEFFEKVMERQRRIRNRKRRIWLILGGILLAVGIGVFVGMVGVWRLLGF